MSTKQTRKSISVSGELYQAIRAKAEAHGDTGSGLVERAMRHHLGLPPRKNGKPDLKKAELPAPRQIGRPVTKLKEAPAQTAPQSDAVEVVTTSASVSVTARAEPPLSPSEKLKRDRAEKFKEWEDKERAKREEQAQREAGNIFTF
jgi:hypothetical protein